MTLFYAPVVVLPNKSVWRGFWLAPLPGQLGIDLCGPRKHYHPLSVKNIAPGIKFHAVVAEKQLCRPGRGGACTAHGARCTSRVPLPPQWNVRVCASTGNARSSMRAGWMRAAGALAEQAVLPGAARGVAKRDGSATAGLGVHLVVEMTLLLDKIDEGVDIQRVVVMKPERDLLPAPPAHRREELAAQPPFMAARENLLEDNGQETLTLACAE